MKVFNAFQLMCLFVAMPFVITWLHTQNFYACGAAFWTCIIIYVVMFCVLVASLADTMKKWE